MTAFVHQPLFELPHDDGTPFRKLSGDFVGRAAHGGHELLTVAPEGLTLLAAQAIRDVSHLFRPGHLAQVRAILDDAEASANDHFVALQMLKNANVAAGMILPSCQDTGTAIVMAFTPRNTRNSVRTPT